MYENFVNNNLSNINGVYIIRNLTNNKNVYIGISCNILQRYKQHRILLENGEHFNHSMVRDYKAGHILEMSILHDFLKQPPIFDRRITEELYIFYFLDNGYNLYNYCLLDDPNRQEQISQAKNRIIKKLIYQSGVAKNSFCNIKGL